MAYPGRRAVTLPVPDSNSFENRTYHHLNFCLQKWRTTSTNNQLISTDLPRNVALFDLILNCLTRCSFVSQTTRQFAIFGRLVAAIIHSLSAAPEIPP